MLKGFVASVGIFLASIFGGGEPAQPPIVSLAQPASAIVALSDTSNLSDSANSSATTTIINQYITQPVIVREVLATNAITREELDASLAALRSDLLSIMASSLPRAYNFSGPAEATPVSTATFSYSQKIDQLSGTSLSNITVNGVSGLTAADIPALSTLSGTLGISQGGTGGTSTTTARSNLGLVFATGADITAFSNSIATWGDSLTYGGNSQTPYPNSLSSLSGHVVYNGGVGGDTSTQIKTRMLAATDKYSWPTIIWAGRNNYTDPTTVKADIAAMISALQSVGNNHYVVLSVLNGADQPTGSSDYNTIAQLNSDLSATYGSRYIDVRSYLISHYDSTIVQDVTDHTNDVIPASLRVDSIHLTSEGYRLVAEKIYNSLDTLLGSSNFTSALLTAVDIRKALSDSQTGYAMNGERILYATSTNFSTLVGVGSGNNLQSNGSYNTALGYLTLSTATSSDFNTAVGYKALQNVVDGGGNLGSSNSAFGANALRNNTTGYYNSAFGSNALTSNTTGYNNVAVGLSTLQANTTGVQNSALGWNAMPFITTGANNSAFGASALYSNVTGNYNVGLGGYALYFNTSATSTTAIGYKAGYGTSGSTHSQNNVFLGFFAGFGNTTGNNNILLGYQAGDALTSGSNNIVIGYDIDAPSPTSSNILNIGNLIYGTGIDGAGTSPSSGNLGVATTSPWRKFSVSGTVGFDGLTGSTGAGSLCLTANREVVYNSASDSCLSSTRATKHDINPLVLDALAQVVALQPVSFIYNNDASSTVRYGFIAEDTAAVDSHLATYDAAGAISGIDDRSVLSVMVRALQSLIGKMNGLIATVASFADRFVSRELVAEDRLCVGSTCVDEAQLQALLANAGSAGNGGDSPTPPEEEESAPDTEAPTITINGNNPATLSVGDTYNDLGATVTDNVDVNLGYQTLVGETPIEQAHIDTSEPNEWHIHYVATDSAGNTATSTRTVIVETPSIVPAEEPETEPIAS